MIAPRSSSNPNPAKKTIVVIDWDRRESASRQANVASVDQLSNVVSRERIINEVVNSALTEHISGRSDSSTGGAGIGGGIAGFDR